MYKKIKTAIRNCSLKCKYIRFGCIVVTIIITSSFLLSNKIDVNASIHNSVQKPAIEYLDSNEDSGEVIDMNWNGVSYYFVPFANNEVLETDLPGMFFDVLGRPVRKINVLYDLYKYPALVLEYASDIGGFRQKAYEIAKETSEECEEYANEAGKYNWCKIGVESWKVLSSKSITISSFEIENSIFAMGQVKDFKKWFELREKTNSRAAIWANLQIEKLENAKQGNLRRMIKWDS